MTDTVVEELYSLPPEQFTPRRDAAAKELSAAGDKSRAAAVKKLRKPTQAGWALNLLARHSAVELGDLIEVGAALRTAQEQLSGPQLRELSQQRQSVVRALTTRARQIAAEQGQTLTEPVAEQVRRSLDAALTDPTLGAALLEGRNTGALEYATGGFGQSLHVVQGGASIGSAAQSTMESPEDAKQRRQDEAAERRRLSKAVADARRAHTARSKQRADLETSVDAAHLRVAAAQQVLDAAVADEEDAETKLDAARTAEADAAQAVDDAELELEPDD